MVKQSVSDWYSSLTKQQKQIFLATVGTNLTVSARANQKALEGYNELFHRLFQLISLEGMDQPTAKLETVTNAAGEQSAALTSAMETARQQITAFPPPSGGARRQRFGSR